MFLYVSIGYTGTMCVCVHVCVLDTSFLRSLPPSHSTVVKEKKTCQTRRRGESFLKPPVSNRNRRNRGVFFSFFLFLSVFLSLSRIEKKQKRRSLLLVPTNLGVRIYSGTPEDVGNVSLFPTSSAWVCCTRTHTHKHSPAAAAYPISSSF